MKTVDVFGFEDRHRGPVEDRHRGPVEDRHRGPVEGISTVEWKMTSV